VRRLATETGPDALPRIFLALRNKKSVDEALFEVTGAKLKEWDLRWRTGIGAQKKEPLPAIFALGGKEPPNMRELRERARLGELLLGREHPAEALLELDKITGKDSLADASLRYIRARCLEALERGKEGEALVADPKEVLAPYGP